MAERDLNQTHPDYKETAAERTRGRDLFAGSRVIKLKRTEYLPQGANEDHEDYKRRLKMAKIDPWCRKIVNARISVLLSIPPERELPSQFEELVDDIDMQGASAKTFFENVARNAQIEGARFVIADAPEVPEGGFASKSAEQDAGWRPFLQELPADALLDWEFGSDRKLIYAVVKETRVKYRTEESFGLAREHEDVWKIWTRTWWDVWKADADTGKVQSIYDNPIPHALGEIPIVPFFGIKNTEMSGWPVCTDIHDHVISCYIHESDLDWFQNLIAHPFPVVMSPEKPEKLDTTKGLWIKTKPNVTADLKMAETSGAAFDSLRKTLQDIRSRILSIALAQAKKDSAQVQSAESQKEDRKEFNASLASTAYAYERAEERCFTLLSKWLGQDGSAINVTYNRDFDDAEIDAAMMSELRDMVAEKLLSMKTFLRRLKDAGHFPSDFDIEEEIKQIREEEEAGIVDRLMGTGAGAADNDEDAA